MLEFQLLSVGCCSLEATLQNAMEQAHFASPDPSCALMLHHYVNQGLAHSGLAVARTGRQASTMLLCFCFFNLRDLLKATEFGNLEWRQKWELFHPYLVVMIRVFKLTTFQSITSIQLNHHLTVHRLFFNFFVLTHCHCGWFCYLVRCHLNHCFQLLFFFFVNEWGGS